MAAATTAPNISQKNSRFPGISAMFDKLSPSDHSSCTSTQSTSKPSRASLPTSQSHNNSKGNQNRDSHNEHVGDGKRLDHKDSRIAEQLPSRAEIWKQGGDEAIAKRPEEKGIGGRSESLVAEDFEPLRILGTGTFARVWQVKMKNAQKEKEIGFGEGKVYALKVLRKDQGLLAQPDTNCGV